MTDWDGRGLPPAAAQRIARAEGDGVATSFLTVPEQAGLDAIGFRAVGEVMGCMVEHVGFQGYGGCGFYGMAGGYSSGGGFARGTGGLGYSNTVYDTGRFETITSHGGNNSSGFGPYVNALYAGWDGAMARMLMEATALGADGVVGVRLQNSAPFGGQAQEFLAYGTAVKSNGTIHVDKPFTTTLVGQDIAKLVTAGWMPASIVVAISVGIRHDDYSTQMATQAYAGNREVPGYTDLVNSVRDDARRQFSQRAGDSGADGAIVSSDMTLRMHELEIAEGHRDHVGEATLIGTAITKFAQHRHSNAKPPLLMLSLKDRNKEKK